MNQAPAPQKTIPPHRTPEPQKNRTGHAYLVLFLSSAVSILLAVLLIVLLCVNPTSPAAASSGNEESSAENPNHATNVSVTYPTAPSRDSYLLSGNGAAIDPSSVYAESAILVSLSDYSVKASIGADTKIYPASMTKIMTLIVACENLEDASVLLTITSETLEFCQREGATYLVTDADPVESFSATDLLYAVGVISAADACLTLADHIAGSEETFVAMMNEKAADLGLTKTHFANCTGLDNDENYSTVREMATILAYALDNPFCKEILSTDYKTTTGHYEKDGAPATYGRHLSNTIWSRLRTAGYAEKIPAKLSCGLTLLGGKTGNTDKGKWCLASFLEDTDGNLYVTVTAAGEAIGTSVKDIDAICKAHT